MFPHLDPASILTINLASYEQRLQILKWIKTLDRDIYLPDTVTRTDTSGPVWMIFATRDSSQRKQEIDKIRIQAGFVTSLGRCINVFFRSQTCSAVENKTEHQILVLKTRVGSFLTYQNMLAWENGTCRMRSDQWRLEFDFRARITLLLLPAERNFSQN